MGGIDRLIAFPLSIEIKKKLNSNILKKVERELFLEHGMSIKLSIEHFQKFTSVLKRNISSDFVKIEKECINKVIRIKKRDDVFLVTIINQDLTDMILELFLEEETRNIMSSLLENEYTIPQILKISKIPKTSGYRKIENLILNGLVVESGKILSKSKKISKLQCVFQEIILDIKKDKSIVYGIISKKTLTKSTSIKPILETLE